MILKRRQVMTLLIRLRMHQAIAVALTISAKYEWLCNPES